jgi:vacuolar-type H+-ATPase subunit H
MQYYEAEVEKAQKKAEAEVEKAQKKANDILAVAEWNANNKMIEAQARYDQIANSAKPAAAANDEEEILGLRYSITGIKMFSNIIGTVSEFKLAAKNTQNEVVLSCSQYMLFSWLKSACGIIES